MWTAAEQIFMHLFTVLFIAWKDWQEMENLFDRIAGKLRKVDEDKNDWGNQTSWLPQLTIVRNPYELQSVALRIRVNIHIALFKRIEDWGQLADF